MKNVKQYIKDAKNALLNGASGITGFAVAYHKAKRDHGDDACKEFRNTFPFFGEREWTRFELVGDGTLDPFFLFKSDSFICKLMRTKNPQQAQADIFSAAYDTCATSEERETNVASLLRTINKSRSAKKRRGSRAILDDLVNVLIALESRRDDEWEFADRHGIDDAFWSKEDEEEHDDILNDIRELRKKASALVKEATGKDISV